MKRSLLLILLLGIGSTLFAQTNCERNLNEARADYSSGNLYAIPGKLADCLEDGFNKTEKIQALRLLTLTYLNINQQEKARSTFIQLLNLKTDYQVKKNIDPSELFSLYRKIDTDVKYYIGLTLGLNLNSIQVVTERHTNPIESNRSANYSTLLSSPQIGAQFLLPITKTFIVGSELFFQNQRFSYFERNDYINELNPGIDYENYNTVNYEVRNNSLNLNLMVRYMKDNYEWKPFVEMVAVGKYNLSYRLLDYVSDYSETTEDESIPELNLYNRRSTANVGLALNLGTMIKLGENYGEVKFGLTNYFINHLNKEARNTAYPTSIGSAMVLKEDDYTNLLYQLSISFNLPFFNFQ